VHRSLLPRCIALFLFALVLTGSGLAAERVLDLTASDGVKLKVTFFPAAKPGPGVLLLHQCNRQRKVWDSLARELATAGINVVTMDLRGFGESGDERQDKLAPATAQAQAAKWPGDIDKAFDFLISQAGVARDTIGVGGASCGVNNSVQTARRHPEVKSLVLLSGNTDLNGRNFLRSASKTPVFFAYADDDEFPPSVFAIQWLYSLAADPEKELVHYATGGHGADIFPVHPELPSIIVDWFVTTLIKTPGHAPVPKETPVLPKEVAIVDRIDQPGGANEVAKMLETARAADPKASLFPEASVNFMGYEHMQAGDMKAAIEILKLNAVASPNSPNVYDSLGDVYLADGQKDLARQNSKKALELLPSDTTDPEARKKGIRDSAEGKLKQLGEGPQ